MKGEKFSSLTVLPCLHRLKLFCAFADIIIKFIVAGKIFPGQGRNFVSDRHDQDDEDRDLKCKTVQPGQVGSQY